ncbi:MAG TPA: SurA N-terminal domain-containing protein, partial [Gemmatimonadales bacterium]|nr:SurA N-terminal domain-containing protein [Gemmatimonadales bacterium]
MVALISITFLAWMVFDLSGLTGRSGFVRPNAVGKVNGLTLDSREYEQMVQQAVQNRQQQSPGALGADDDAALRDQVWNNWVDQAVLLAEYRRRGLTVTDEELADAIRTTPLPELEQNTAFQTDGQFDMAKYQRWLTSATAAQLLPVLEDRYRQEMLRSKLLRVISA